MVLFLWGKYPLLGCFSLLWEKKGAGGEGREVEEEKRKEGEEGKDGGREARRRFADPENHSLLPSS